MQIDISRMMNEIYVQGNFTVFRTELKSYLSAHF